VSTLIRWDPLRSIATLQAKMNRLLDGTRTFSDRTDQSNLTTSAPAVDIHGTENELVVRADVPGLEEKDLDVRIENNMFTIRGERKLDRSISEDNYLRLERVHGSFSRSFSLPRTVNTEVIEADDNCGVLAVRLPKREDSKPKQVKINVEQKWK